MSSTACVDGIVHQENVHDCLAACLAMVTGHSLQDVKDEVTTPTPHIEALAYLSRHGYVYHQLPLVESREVSCVLADRCLWYDKAEPVDERTAILTVESPRNDVEWHAIVYSCGEVYDPVGYWESIEDVEQLECTFAIEVSG